jgi:hypothetical protein
MVVLKIEKKWIGAKQDAVLADLGRKYTGAGWNTAACFG